MSDESAPLENDTGQFAESSSVDPRLSVNSERGLNSVPPHEPHPSRLPIGTIRSFDSFIAAYTEPHSSQAAMRLDSPFLSTIISESIEIREECIVSTAGVTVLLVTTVTTDDRSAATRTDRRDGESR